MVKTVLGHYPRKGVDQYIPSLISLQNVYTIKTALCIYIWLNSFNFIYLWNSLTWDVDLIISFIVYKWGMHRIDKMHHNPEMLSAEKCLKKNHVWSWLVKMMSTWMLIGSGGSHRESARLIQLTLMLRIVRFLK